MSIFQPHGSEMNYMPSRAEIIVERSHNHQCTLCGAWFCYEDMATDRHCKECEEQEQEAAEVQS